MFHFHKRRSFYPLVIAALTVALGTLMFLTFSRSAQRPAAEAVPAVTESDYREQAHSVIAPFLASYQAADTDVRRLVAVEDALNALMKLTVPVSYKDVHLGLAVSLTLMRDGLRGESGALDDGYAKLMDLIGDYPWLSQ